MSKGILGRKVGMTQIYDESGKVIPVTVIQAGPCRVLQLRTMDRDRYEAVQLGFLDKKRPKSNRPRSRGSQASRAERGHVTTRLNSKRAARISEGRGATRSGLPSPPKAECEPQRYVREIRGPIEGYEVGAEVTVSRFAEVAAVDVTGTSKGRGYAGVMKRHNFSGQRASHGVKKVHRHPGGTGMSATPSRTLKGRRMAGQYGNTQVTVRNLKLVRVDEDNHLLLLYGAVPGPNGGFLVIRETNKVG